MAIVEKAVVELATDSTYFDVVDTTGVFDSVNNTGGYNAPNPDTDTVEEIVISITRPGQTTAALFVFAVASGTITDLTFFDEAGGTTAIAPFSPVVFDENFSFRVLASYFDLEEFEDGDYAITYTIYSPLVPYEYSVTVGGSSYFLALAECCLKDKLIQFAQGRCACSDTSDLLMNDLYLKSARASANCRDINAANRALALSQRICDGGCGC